MTIITATPTNSTHAVKQNARRRHRGGRRPTPGYEWVGSRTQVALMATIGRPFA